MGRYPSSDDGSPARLIATMVGIVGILLLGSLAWSAVGALFNALGEATATLSNARPTPGRFSAIVGTATTTIGVTPTVPAAVTTAATSGATNAATRAPTSAPTAAPISPPTTAPTSAPTLALTAAPSTTPRAAAVPTPTVLADGRVPWILLPQPAPGGRIAPGNTTIEARARGDAPIASMRLELDGAALPGAFEQRDSATWRVSATTKVTPGQHAVRAVVVDERGRTGGFRWNFEAAP